MIHKQMSKHVIDLSMAVLPTEETLLSRAYLFYRSLHKAMQSGDHARIELALSETRRYQVTILKPVFDELKRAYDKRYETQFLLFADPKTNIIVAAADDKSGERYRHAIMHSPEFVRRVVEDMRKRGLELVGTYHSHTGPTSLADTYKNYNYALPSKADVGVFPNVTGMRFAEMRAPKNRDISKDNRIMFVGSDANGAFSIRAFVPVWGAVSLGEYNGLREVDTGKRRMLKTVLEQENLMGAVLVRHYNPNVPPLIEFRVTVE